ncbi:MAG: hypothetical protein J5835_07900 [Bacteroidales bacterium]|nr:hypothetical protein [Bacteroidales bacterium]
MKKFFIFSLIGLLSLAVSCEGVVNDLGIKAPGIDKSLDSHSDVPCSDLIGFTGVKTVKTATDGHYFVEELSKGEVKVALSSSGEQKVGDKVTIDGSQMPKSTIPDEGSTSTRAVLVTLTNTSDKDVVFDANISVDNGKEAPLAPVTVPANSSKTIAYLNDQNAETPDVSFDKAEILPEASSDQIDKGFNTIDIKDIKLSHRDKATNSVSAAAAAEFTISAKYYRLLAFSAATKLTIKRSFNDLRINFDNIDYDIKEYKVYIDVENSIPFDIKVSGKTDKGIVITTDDVIKAGTPDNHVKSSIVLNVVDPTGEKVSEVVSAVLTLELTAAKGAKFAKGQSLKIDASKLKIVKI